MRYAAGKATRSSMLTPAEEFKARVAIARPVDNRLRLGLPAVIGQPDGSAATIRLPDALRAVAEATPSAPFENEPPAVRLNVITGPSGAGKSVFCKSQPDWEHCLYNLDDFARTIGDAEDSAIREEAWQALIAALRRRMTARPPTMCVDGVLGQADCAAVAAAAQENGYPVFLWVVAPSSATVCAERIRLRKAEGGHGRPEQAGELYESALSAAGEFSVECEHTFLIDSTTGIRSVAHLKGFRATVFVDELPKWTRDYFWDSSA